MHMRPAWLAFPALLLGAWLAPAQAQQTAADTTAAARTSPGFGANVCARGTEPSTSMQPCQPSTDAPGVVVGARIGELYTDNLRLTGGSQPRQSAWITEVAPYIQAAWASPRGSGLLDYTLTGYAYAGHSDNNQVAHNLRAQGQLVLLPQHLFVSGNARYTRQLIDASQPTAQGTFFLSGNQANVATIALSPYWVQDLGRVGMLTVRYRAGRVVYNRNGLKANGQLPPGLSNTSSRGASLDLTSPERETWGWQLGYSRQHLRPDRGRSTTFARAHLEVSHQVGLYGRVLVDAGRENRYLPDGRVDQMGASFWDVGWQWSNLRNSFEIRGGHRFYGRSMQLSWAHHAARLTTTVSYTEQPTDLSQQLLGNGLNGGSLHLPSSMLGDLSLRQRGVYLMKRAALSASYDMAHGQLTLALTNTTRDYFLFNTGSETVSNADLSWRFELGAFTSITPALGWQRRKLRDGQLQHTRIFRLGLMHKFSPADFLELQLRHDTRRTRAMIGARPGYRVNVYFLQWTHLF